MYNPHLANFIASFIIDAESFLSKIEPTNPQSFIQYSRYIISNLFIAAEMILKEIANNRVDKVDEKLSDSRFQRLLRNRFNNDINRLKEFISKKSIEMEHLIAVYRYGTVPNFFGLQEISDLEIQDLDKLRGFRNDLFHDGRVSFQDYGTIQKSFGIIKKIFERLYFIPSR